MLKSYRQKVDVPDQLEPLHRVLQSLHVVLQHPNHGLVLGVLKAFLVVLREDDHLLVLLLLVENQLGLKINLLF